MTMITPSYLGETIEYSSLHACRSTLEDPTSGRFRECQARDAATTARPGRGARRVRAMQNEHREAQVVRDDFERAKTWTQEHLDVGFDLLRVYLGVALMVRGAVVMAHPELAMRYLGRFDWLWPSVIVHYVIAAHVVGGLLLAMGMVTRLAALVQIPALLGAVLFAHVRERLFSSSQSLELSGLVLAMLAVFSVFGAGRLSVDHYVFGSSPFVLPARTFLRRHPRPS